MVTAHGREMLAEKEAHEISVLSGFLVKPVTTSMLLESVMGPRLRLNNQTAPAAKAEKVKRLLVSPAGGGRQQDHQAVAQGLLTQEGAIVTLADNGRLGVDAVLTMQPAYDAVLMDLQMPVMDGFEIRGPFAPTCS